MKALDALYTKNGHPSTTFSRVSLQWEYFEFSIFYIYSFFEKRTTPLSFLLLETLDLCRIKMREKAPSFVYRVCDMKGVKLFADKCAAASALRVHIPVAFIRSILSLALSQQSSRRRDNLDINSRWTKGIGMVFMKRSKFWFWTWDFISIHPRAQISSIGWTRGYEMAMDTRCSPESRNNTLSWFNVVGLLLLLLWLALQKLCAVHPSFLFSNSALLCGDVDMSS